MNEESRPEAALDGSGGPAAAPTVADTPAGYTPHDCIESDIVWALLAGTIPAPNTWAFRVLLDLAEAMTQRRLAGIRPVLAHSGMWASIPNRYDDLAQLRDTYDNPPQSPKQIAARTRYSWQQFERGKGPLHEQAARIRAVIYA